MICDKFCTVNCINGNCPVALREEYEERCMPIVRSCNECGYHISCDDCDWQGTDMCDKHIKESAELSGGTL